MCNRRLIGFKYLILFLHSFHSVCLPACVHVSFVVCVTEKVGERERQRESGEEKMEREKERERELHMASGKKMPPV